MRGWNPCRIKNMEDVAQSAKEEELTQTKSCKKSTFNSVFQLLDCILIGINLMTLGNEKLGIL
jgi:hypothetical protein